MSDYIRLQTESILDIPLSRYEKDFTFIVNGKEFYTSQFIADLLSPTVSKARINDPTLRKYYINTQSKGDFQQILDLVNFKQHEITTNNRAYIFEVLEQLGTGNVDINYSYDELTIDNVIKYIKDHEFKPFFKTYYSKEIDFLSSHFSEALEQKKDELFTISNISIENVLKNENLVLSNEDDLLLFVNDLYLKDCQFSNLFEYVYFTNVSSNTMSKFIEIFDDNDLNRAIWNSISKRLVQEIKKDDKLLNERYKSTQKYKGFQYSNNEFEGIINYLQKNSNIKDEINITYSSDNNNGYNNPYGLFEYSDKSKRFLTRNEQNSWICFEFKNHKIIPYNYTIRSNNHNGQDHHPKSWRIEGSLDGNKWEVLSEENNTSLINGYGLSHTFSIKNQKNLEIKFIRIYQTGPNSGRDYYLYISAFEVFGKLI